MLVGQLLLFVGFLSAVFAAAQAVLWPADLQAAIVNTSSQRDIKTGTIRPPSLWARVYLIFAIIGLGCFSYGGVWFGLSWMPTSFGSFSDGEFRPLRQSLAGIGAICGAIALAQGVLLFAEYRRAHLDQKTPPEAGG